jgi:WD40 repeat protein/tRNA A-37 threonylcarbamoyl transferase component Bud32
MSLAASEPDPLEQAAESFLARVRAGERPSLGEYEAKHPELAADIRALFTALLLLEEGRRCVDRPPAPDPPRLSEELVPPSPVFSLPRPFGAHELLEEIGRGGMGVVYKARQVKLNRLVAVKLVLGGSHSGPEELARIRTEAEAIARLQHPNIVQIFEVGEQDGLPFLALEYCPGGSLAKRLAGTPLPPREAARLVEQLAQAVHAAHEQKVVHRDLKLANVLLAADGAVKVSDFGLAKRLDVTGQTASGAIMGTPSYMAPEQARGQSKEVGPGADVYALGAMLYELLTGRPPFRAATQAETLLQVIGDDPVPPRRLQPQLPRDLETICLKCLEKDPSRRYASADALADDLERWLSGEPIRVRPANLRELAVKWARRRPALAALTAAAALLVALLLAVTLWGWGQASRAEQAAEEKAAAQKERADEAARRAKYIDAHLALEKGTNWIDRGEIARGLLWLVRGLEVAPADAGELQRSLRTLLDSWGRRVPQIRMAFPHFLPRYKPLQAMALSPDGKVLVTAGYLKAQFWDTATGNPLGPPLPLPPEQQTVRVAFCPDSKTVITVGESGALRWEVSRAKQVGKPLLRPWPVGDGVFDVAFSSDGKLLATAHSRSAQLWDATSGKPVGPSLPHPRHVFAVAFSPDSKTVATACGDGRARLWEVGSGKLRGKPLEQPSACVRVLFSPDGRTLLTSDSPGVLRFWDVARGVSTREPWGVDGVTCQFDDTVFSRDGRFVLTAESRPGLVRVWDLATNRPVGSPVRHPGVDKVAFCPDGQGFLTAGDRRAPVLLWRLEEQKPVEHLPVRFGSPVDLSPDGKLALVSNPQDPNTKELWEVAGGKLLCRFSHKERVHRMIFSPDSKAVAMITGKDVYCWDVGTGKPLGQPIPIAEGVDRVALSPGGQSLFTVGKRTPKPGSGGEWHTHQLWDVRTGKPRGEAIRTEVLYTGATIKTRTRPVEAPVLRLTDVSITVVTFSPDGKTLVLALGAGHLLHEVQVREAATGKIRETLWKQGERRAPPLTGLVFSPDGKKLLMVSSSGQALDEARLWDLANGKFLGEPLRVRSRYWSAAAFSPDGRTVAIASAVPPHAAIKSRGSARLWDAATGKPLGEVYVNTPVAAVAFRPDGKTLVTVSPDANGVNVWKAPSPLEGDVERIRLWVEVLTGLELDSGRAVVESDAKTWRERWELLQKFGGPPAR